MFLNFFLLLVLSFPFYLFGEPQRAYLATYPRSGNHWMRNLIEEATHVATGSVYCDMDPQHLPTPFHWGGFSPENGVTGVCCQPEGNETIVIKTHFPVYDPTSFDLQPAFSTVRIVRHPVDSFYSYYLYFYDGNVPRDKPPYYFVCLCIKDWIRFQDYWSRQPNVLTLRYEDVYENPAIYLKVALDALHCPYNEEDIVRAIDKYPPVGGFYKHAHHFDAKALKKIRDDLRPLLRQFNYPSF